MAVAEHAPSVPGAQPAPEKPVEIVPVKALPVVAVILACLVAAIATNSHWALNFFHVVGGGIWTALDLFLGFVIGPIIGAMSIPGRIELTKKLMPKMVLLIPTLVTMTLAAGSSLLATTACSTRRTRNTAGSSPRSPSSASWP
jgi:hypothetical protein